MIKCNKAEIIMEGEPLDLLAETSNLRFAHETVGKRHWK